MSLKHAFKKFTGKELTVYEKHMSLYSRALKRTTTRTERSLGDSQTVRDIFALAAKNNMYVRIFWEHQAPQNTEEKRLNLFIKKTGSKYVVDKLTKG